MLSSFRGLLAVTLVLAVVVVTARAQDDKVDNPMYKFWSKFKPGASVTVVEKTKFTGADKDNLPGGIDSKTITYRLAAVNPKQVVVVTTVVTEEFLGTVESAATKITYPAMISKSQLEAALQEFGAKPGPDETVKAAGKQIKCKVLAGTYKKDNMVIDYKFCYSDEVPGGVVKRTRTTKEGDKVVAETTIEVRSFAEGKAPKKDKKEKE